jgi:hypothetical protein
MEPRLLVAMGCFDGISAANVYGNNPDVGTSFEVISEAGVAAHTFAAAATLLDVTSSSATDAAAGDGARTLLITGLDADYNEITETVTLNGTTVVETTSSFLRVNKAQVLTTGDEEDNAGDIYVTETGGTHTAGVPDNLAIVDAKIPAGFCLSESTIYTVPAGHSLYIHTVNVFCSGGRDTIYRGRIRNPATATQTVIFEGVGTDMQSNIIRGSMVVLPEKFSVWGEARVITGSGEVALSIDGWLVDDTKWLIAS